MKQSSEDELQKEPFSDMDISLVKDMLRQSYNNQLNNGLTSEQAKAVLKTIEPFNNYEELIEEL